MFSLLKGHFKKTSNDVIFMGKPSTPLHYNIMQHPFESLELLQKLKSICKSISSIFYKRFWF